MARANPHWKEFADGREVLVTFLGPHAYISPSWYVDQVTVPTWNYAAVHCYGSATIVENTALLREQVLRLVHEYEGVGETAWDPGTAEPIMETELKAIVGFEIPIDRIEGKLKFNQNRSREDRAGVAEALGRSPDPLARKVAETMRSQLEH